MLNYNDRLNQAWDKVPEQHKKQILEELEHRAYQQDFNDYTNDEECNYDDSCNPIEILVDAIIDCIKVIAKHI